ncbi:hypothetical protein ABIA60_001612 [Pseudomonas frederiksbergensis]
MQSITIPHPMNQPPHNHFGLCVGRAHSTHPLASLAGGQGIHALFSAMVSALHNVKPPKGNGASHSS